LTGLGITNVADFALTSDELLVLEINAKSEYKLHRLDRSGKALNSTFDIPQGFHLEDGLTGLWSNEKGDVFLEMEFGLRLVQIIEKEGQWTVVKLDGYPTQGRSYDLQAGKIKVGDLTVDLPFDAQYGTLIFLGANPDGGFLVMKENVVFQSPSIQVDQTIHLFDAMGKQWGVARFPLEDQILYLRESLSLASDGQVYGLVTQPDKVKVVRLNFYEEMAPFLPYTEESSVSVPQ